MASAASANGSTHSLSAGPATPGNSSGGGGMEELLPLVLQLTNAESVSAALCCVTLCYVVCLPQSCVRGIPTFCALP